MLFLLKTTLMNEKHPAACDRVFASPVHAKKRAKGAPIVIMTADTLPRIRLNLRAKILIVLLGLSVISILITGFFAFTSLTDIGRYAQGSSRSLGENALSDSSAALQATAEEYLVQVATDQANITNVLFEDSNSEMDILAAHAAMLANNPPLMSSIPSYPPTVHPPDPFAGTLLEFAPGSNATPASEEVRLLAGMDDMLRAVYVTDEDMTGVYIASDSGVMREYPWNPGHPAGYDPRNRTWFKEAILSKNLTWSDAPYVDASGHGLVMTCSKAIASQYGYWVIGSDVSINTINEDFLSQTLGGKGYSVIIDRDGNVISQPGLSAGTTQWNEPFRTVNASSSEEPGLREIVADMTTGKTGIGRAWFNGTETYVAYAPIHAMNWSLAVSLPVEEVTGPMRKTEDRIVSATIVSGQQITDETTRLLTIFAVLFFILLLAAVFMSFTLARIITKPVEILKSGTEAIGKGDLDYRVTIRSGDEFEELANSFNSMAEDLKKSIENLRLTTAQKERYTKELEIARTIQVSFLPEEMPDITGVEIAATAIPALEVGGDFYDFIPVSRHRWALVIADVSGKGVSAALFMALSRTLLRACVEGKTDTTTALREANRFICRDAQSSMFVTVFSAILDPERQTLSCINAGHNPPLVVRGDSGVVTFLRQDGIAMGVIPEMVINEDVVTLKPGDLVVMYTDGVTEAFNDKMEEFGEERLTEIARTCRFLPAGEVIRRILSAIHAFTGNTPQSDDITLVVLRVISRPGSAKDGNYNTGK
jgi:phosphoserine phosphatase RsbU/P